MGFFAFLGFIAWAILMVLILKKAGYSGLQIILLFIPVVNVIVFVWFALSEWPIQKEEFESISFTSSGAPFSSRKVRSDTTAVLIPERNSSKSNFDHLANSSSRHPPITDVSIYILGVIIITIS